MQKTKEELITELYALRGGLSLISQNVDVIRRNDEEKEQIVQKQREIDVDLEYNAREIKKNIIEKEGGKKYQHYIERLKKNREKNRVLVSQQRGAARERAERWKKIAQIFLTIAIVFPIVCIVLIITKLEKDPEIAALGMYGLVLIEPLFPLLTMAFFKKFRNVCNDWGTMELWELRREIREDEEYLQEHKSEIEMMPEREKALEEILRDLELKNKKYLQDKEKLGSNLLELEHQPRVEVARQNAEAIEASLHEIYDGWITESDWGNVDLLIFYLDTGRADTLKEALLLVDKQRQTDQIVNAINSASRAICNTIQRNMSAMAEGIVGCFKQMSVQMQKNAEANRRALEGMGQKISDQMKVGFEQQLEVSKLNNALLEKSNETSRELLADLKYFRGEWEEERWEEEWDDD